MKITIKNIMKFVVLGFLVVTVSLSCTKLEPKLRNPDSIAQRTPGGAPTPSSLSKVYEQLNQLLGSGGIYAMAEHPTDELLGPTRGTDWDDFGV